MPEPRSDVVAYHAGSLNSTMSELGPAFTRATGFTVQNIGGPSVGLADQIAAGEIQADIFMSADAEVNDQVLMGNAANSRVTWYFLMARQRMVLLYSRASRFASELLSAPWYEVVQRPGFVLQRSDPRNDPGGYRAVFVFQLAERHYGVPGLAARVFGPPGPDNEAQIATRATIDGLRNGQVDGFVGYVTSARDWGLPYLTLPDEVDQSNPELADFYVSAAYTNPRGQVFHGSPLVYSVAIPAGPGNAETAEAFVRYLVTEPGQAILERHGFGRVEALVGGDRKAVPASLHDVVQGTYAPPRP